MKWSIIAPYEKMLLVCSAAGVGKSTFCNKYIAEHPQEDIHIISADETRKGMTGGYDKFLLGMNMEPVYEAMIERGKELAQNDNVTILTTPRC